MSLVQALGQDGARYRRESGRHLRAIVSEIYSAPRVTEAARKHPYLGSIPGLALDPTSTDEEGNAWNFELPEMRAKAEKLLDEQQPVS